MPDFEELCHSMIDCQLRPNGINDADLLNAFRAIHRELFVPSELASLAYSDRMINPGSGSLAAERPLCSPLDLARLCQLANFKKNDLVLVVGCGRGYSASVISHLVSAVVAIDNNQVLTDLAQENVATLGIDNVIFYCAALLEGFGNEGPYDAIIVESMADISRLEPLFKQLRPQGRLVCSSINRGVERASLHVKTETGISSQYGLPVQMPKIQEFEPVSQFVF